MSRVWKHTETAAERGYGAAWKRLRVLILARDCGLCQCTECKTLGRLKPATQVDHILPKSKGGTDEMGNLQAIAADCHQRKTLTDEGKTPRREIGLDGWPLG